jgi:hypothetical protein
LNGEEDCLTAVRRRYRLHHGRRLVAAAAAALGSDLLLGQIERIVRDDVVILSDGRSGGTSSVDIKPNLMSPKAQAWLWSGEVYQESG